MLSRVDSKHMRPQHGAFKPKQHKAFSTIPRQRRKAAVPASWMSRWKTRQKVAPPPTGIQTQLDLAGPLAIARERIRQAEKAEQEARREPKLILHKTVQVGPECVSVNRFHTIYTAHTDVFIFSQLPAYYTDDAGGPDHVRHATHAVALLAAAKSLRQPSLMMKARRNYCKALSAFNHALREPKGVQDDANLVTLFLFGLYEGGVSYSCSRAIQVIDGPRGKNTVDLQENVYPHGAGGLELFKYRADHGLSNEVDRGCFMYFCHAALMEFFIRRSHLTPLWLVLEMVETPWGRGPILEPLVRQVIAFKKGFDALSRAQNNEAEPGKKTSPEALSKLLREGINVSDNLAAAVTFLGFSNVSSCSGRQQKLFNGLFIVTGKKSGCIAKSHYRALKIYVLERIMDLLSMIKESGGQVDEDVGPVPTWSDGVAVVEEIMEDMRAIFGLEGREQSSAEGTAYRTMTMFWPVVMARTSCFAGPRNGRWISEKMLDLSSSVGFGLGLEAAAV
ncbi:hypothetical protein CTA2_10294 [Colletotrichum tanaceti]|uniref:C6 zinc finger domain-containing protein n=1 Tax=Colletotrichum tanaceti TaxID=1306861 RepID=A0A4U6X190_9PEZI|nr:hypothetical protein CTA2_10294 [Colletotrichum tanaceti]TKW48509.1 hypothetical protein CTA1_4282 [Colletotrichum tanaceti]